MTRESTDGESHNKPCTLCGTPRPVLVRCQIDETSKWHFVCPGKCWTSVSGGEVDAKGHETEHPYYRYGGMWKNRHADGPLNAKKPKRGKNKNKKKMGREATAPENPSLDESDRVSGSSGDEEAKGAALPADDNVTKDDHPADA